MVVSEGNSRIDLVYFAPVGPGGLSKYAVAQCAELAVMGCRVIFLGRRHMRSELCRKCPSVQFEELIELPEVKGGFARLLRWVRTCRSEVAQLRNCAANMKPRAVLITAFAEYFAPFWSYMLRRLRLSGVRIGVVVHDPVRDFRIGPRWWHQFCISDAYSVVDIAFTHDETALDTGWPARKINRAVIPHGCYQLPLPEPLPLKRDIRGAVGIPLGAKVALSFGHIRDGKNLHLVIRAMAHQQDIHLLVVGKEQSASQKPISYYQKLAEQLGVESRCHWVHGFVPEENAHRYFIAADVLVLLYSGDFKSASGVLNDAAQFGLKVLCSSGGGPLQSVVEQYRLGCWIPPDDLTGICAALASIASEAAHVPDWEKYRSDHSWLRNAETVQKFLLDSP